MRAYFVPAIFILLVILLGVGLTRNPREVPSPLVGKVAPDLSLAVLHDPAKNFSPKEMAGRVWMLNVWASWCPPCLEEHPVITELAESGAAAIVGLNYKDGREDALAWLKRNGDPFIVSVHDPAGRVGLEYGVYGVPETYVIDKRGIIRYKHIGPLKPETAAEKVRPLLRQLSGES